MHNINSILRKLLLESKTRLNKQWKRNSAFVVAGVLFIGIVSEAVFFNKTADTTPQDSKVAMIQDEVIPEAETAELESDEILRVMGTMTLVQEVEADTEATSVEANETKPEETVTEAEPETEPEKKAVISYTEEDYNNFLRIVEAEATGGDIKAKILVANVIINRVKSLRFPGTLTEVIYQGNGEQFQPIMDGRFYSVSITGSTIEAVDRALLGEDYSQGALFFAATASVTPYSWHATSLTRLFEYGGHVYFTF